MRKETKEVLESIISDIDPSRDEWGYESSILVCLDPYSSEQKEAMIKALNKVIEIIKEKL